MVCFNDRIYPATLTTVFVLNFADYYMYLFNMYSTSCSLRCALRVSHVQCTPSRPDWEADRTAVMVGPYRDLTSPWSHHRPVLIGRYVWPTRMLNGSYALATGMVHPFWMYDVVCNNTPIYCKWMLRWARYIANVKQYCLYHADPVNTSIREHTFFLTNAYCLCHELIVCRKVWMNVHPRNAA